MLSHFGHVQFFATLWDSSLPGFSVHGILQATAVGCCVLYIYINCCWSSWQIALTCSA